MRTQTVSASLVWRNKRKSWYLQYRLPGERAYRRKSLNCRDKQVAQAKMLNFIRDYEREAAGIIAPSQLRQAAESPVKEHLEAFIDVSKPAGVLTSIATLCEGG